MRLVNVDSRSKSFKLLFEEESTYAVTLALMMIDEYGFDWLEWHPTTIATEIMEDFGAQAVRTNLDKIMTSALLLTTNAFYVSLPSFIEICNVLADNDYDPEVFDPATPEEIAWGITEAWILDPPEDGEEFCEEIKHYIREALNDEGIINPPDILRLAAQTSKSDPLADFNTDPEMYSAIWKLQQEKTEYISTMLQSNVAALVLQLETLQLQNGNTKNFVEKVKASGLIK